MKFLAALGRTLLPGLIVLVAATLVADAARRLPNTDGVIIAGHDGTAQQILNVDSSGNLNVTSAAASPVIVGGPAADDAAASGNPVPVGGIYRATLPTYTDLDRTQFHFTTKGSVHATLVALDGTQNNAFTPSADARATSVSGFFFNTHGYTFNGSTLDRTRSVVNATDSTGTGIAAAGILAQCDDTSPTAASENQFGNLRRACATAELLVTPTVAGSVNTMGSSAADGITNAVNGLWGNSHTYAFNGTTWDRERSVINATDSIGTGIAAAGILAQCDDTTPTAVTENQFGNVRRDCATGALAAAILPAATAINGGTTLYTLTAANSTNATNVKASAGQVYGLTIENVNATTPAWLSLYNNAGAPTCGTGIIQQFLVPSTATGGTRDVTFQVPKTFSSGIAFCLTTGIAGTGSVAASSYVVNIDYK